MSNGLHSQAWLLAGEMVIGVAVILVTGICERRTPNHRHLRCLSRLPFVETRNT